MTAMLGCDGCGAIVSERVDDDDPTRRWLCVTEGPTIGGGMAGLAIALAPIDEAAIGDPIPPAELDCPAPARHFCNVACLASWALREVEA